MSLEKNKIPFISKSQKTLQFFLCVLMKPFSTVRCTIIIAVEKTFCVLMYNRVSQPFYVHQELLCKLGKKCAYLGLLGDWRMESKISCVIMDMKPVPSFSDKMIEIQHEEDSMTFEIPE